MPRFVSEVWIVGSSKGAREGFDGSFLREGRTFRWPEGKEDMIAPGFVDGFLTPRSFHIWTGSRGCVGGA